MRRCIAKPKPDPQSFQKEDSLNHPTTTVIPKTFFQNCEKSDKDEGKDVKVLSDKRLLFGSAGNLQEVLSVHKE